MSKRDGLLSIFITFAFLGFVFVIFFFGSTITSNSNAIDLGLHQDFEEVLLTCGHYEVVFASILEKDMLGFNGASRFSSFTAYCVYYGDM